MSEAAELVLESEMSRTNRSAYPNVQIYDFNRPTDVLGGFLVVQDITTRVSTPCSIF